MTHEAPHHTQSCECEESVETHRDAAFGRRAFLRRSIGSLAALSLGGTLAGWLTDGGASGVSALYARTAESTGPVPLPQDAPVKSIVLLWMDGGPSQMETFDPKPGHRNGGPSGAIATAIPGVKISANMPRTAEVLDRFTVIRAMSTREGNHQRARDLMHTGFVANPTVAYPGLGSIVAFEKGDFEAPLPQNIALNAPGHRAGILGLDFDPFSVRNMKRPVDNLYPSHKGMTDERIDRRLEFLKAQQESFQARLGGNSTHIADSHSAIVESAVRFMRAEEAAAFSLDDESETVKAAYGDSDFGRGCLMARRLVEQGVPFVEVTLSGWDTHQDNFTRAGELCGEMDPAVAALIRDLEERDLMDSTLVVWMGEFGRTPKINPNEGRDHYPKAWSVAMAGAGVKRGVVLGETSADGTEVVGSAVETADLFRTILWLAGIDPDYQYYSPKGRPLTYADGGRILRGAVSLHV
ncbi:MAG: DUF1501 domain-containing protein [Sumerlaeia bacterium]